MITTITISIIWLLGAVISFLMARTEIAADQEPYTFGSRLLIITLSILSFAFVLVMLINSWVGKIRRTGFWDRPITKEVEEVKLKQSKPVLN